MFVIFSLLGFSILKLCARWLGSCFLLAFGCFFVVFVKDLLIFFAWSCCPVFDCALAFTCVFGQLGVSKKNEEPKSPESWSLSAFHHCSGVPHSSPFLH